ERTGTEIAVVGTQRLRGDVHTREHAAASGAARLGAAARRHVEPAREVERLDFARDQEPGAGQRVLAGAAAEIDARGERLRERGEAAVQVQPIGEAHVEAAAGERQTE